MRKIIYLCLGLILFVSNLKGQTCDDVTLAVKTTESTCQSNGSIEVTLSGSSVADLVNIQYSLTSLTGSLAVGPVSNNIFNSLPSGTYKVEAVGYCKNLAGSKILRTLDKVQVGGSYKESILTFVAPGAYSTSDKPTSRKSYSTCSTGIIVLEMKDGLQTSSSTPLFTITSAPSGVTVPQVINVTRSTDKLDDNIWRYTLDGDSWPAGIYTISANDGCYSSVSIFMLEALTTVPSFPFIYSTDDISTCSTLKAKSANTALSNPTMYPDTYRYISDDMYEYSVATQGNTPKTDSWHIYSTDAVNTTAYFDLSPSKSPDFYVDNSIYAYVRLKKCPALISDASTGSLYKPYSNSYDVTTAEQMCSGIRYYEYEPVTYGNVIYPLTVTVTDKNTGAFVSSNVVVDSNTKRVKMELPAGVEYQLYVTDACGYEYKGPWLQGPIIYPPNPMLTNIDLYSYSNLCSSYTQKVISSYSCGYGTVNVTISDESGTYTETKEISLLTSSSYGYTTFSNLKYGVKYNYVFNYEEVGHNTVYTTSLSKTIESPIPKSISMSVDRKSSECSGNVGKLTITATHSDAEQSRGYFRSGTTVTVTGPEGYVSQSFTKKTNDNMDYYMTLPETYLPSGEYVATVVSCDSTFVTKLTVKDGYKVANFDYKTEKDCIGTKYYPSGSVYLDGDITASTYYQIIQSPPGSGLDTKTIREGTNDFFLLSTPGTYVLAIKSYLTTGCVFDQKIIEYTPPVLSLNADYTSAYACPTGNTGYLTVQAANGTQPYTYTLYDQTNTVQLVPPIESSTSVTFDYGEANKTYNVRISDACGNNFVQEVTLVRLDEAALIYGSSSFCYNSTIRLLGFSVTDATYSWTGPNNFTSSLAKPEIPNATKVNEGWYEVTIYSEKCDYTVKERKYITVNEPLNIVDLHGTTQEVSLCPLEGLSITQEASGGSGSFTYQWAYSSDGIIYTDLIGETRPTFTTITSDYIFTNTKSTPSRRYLRLTIDDGVCDPYLIYYHTNVRGCLFYINPNLRSPVSE